MLYLILKALISGVIIMAASEIAKRSPAFGAFVAALPLISVLAMIWLWRDTRDVERIAEHSAATFWYVLPSLPMFLVLPLLLRHGKSFWLALAGCVVMTALLYLATAALARRLGYAV